MIDLRSGLRPTNGMLLVATALAYSFIPPAQAAEPARLAWADSHLTPTSQLTVVSPTRAGYAEDLVQAMADCYRSLSDSQVPLDADIAKILHDNLWDLYIED